MLEAQEGPKSTPRREKIEVQKQDVFQVDFLEHLESVLQGIIAIAGFMVDWLFYLLTNLPCF